MRKTVLALFLALVAVSQAAVAMEGFDLGDMPPLPPPLLDDSGTSAAPLTPPASGAQSPLLQGQGPGLMPPPSMPQSPLGGQQVPSSAGLTPATPPPASTPGGYSPPTGSFGAPAGDFSGTPLPPPPPLAPPPVDEDLFPPTTAGTTTATATTPGLPGDGDLAPPPLPTQTGTGETAGLDANEIPRAGQITGGRVNVRAGPNTQYESIAVLTTGTPMTVLAKNGEWYKIVYPADHLASIHKKFVDAEIPGEIPEAGIPGVINQDNADVHAFYWDKSTVVGKLNKGDPVVIKQERGQWYRIVAPANARAFVFAKYVKLDSEGPVVADAAPLPVNASVDMSATGPDGTPTAKVKMSPEEEKVRELKEARAKQLQVDIEKLKEQEELARKREEERLRRIEEQQKQAEELVKARAKADLDARMLQANQLDAAIRDLDARLGAIDGEKMRQADIMGRRFGQMVNPATVVGGAAGWAPPDPPTGGYVGWIENIGRVGGAPTPFRLTKGGEIRFWLVSEKHDLDRFTNLRVLLDGEIEHAGGTSASILKVEQIRLLTEWEIAGGMPPSFAPQRQQMPGQQAPGQQMPGRPGAPGPFGPGQQPPQQQQPYIDPYANAADVTDYNQPGFERPPPPQQPQFGQPGQPGYLGAQPGYVPPATDPFAVYGGTSGYTTGYGQQYGQYGDPYASRPSDDNVGTADLVTSVESVFGSGYAPNSGSYGGTAYDAGSYGVTQSYSGGGYYTPNPTPEFPNAQPATGEIRPSDSSQLPDVVGGMSNYSTSAGIVSGEGLGLRVGEVETDIYERPIVNEIIP